MQKENKRVPPWLTQVLDYDKRLTKEAFEWFDRKYGYERQRQNLKFLEYSCHGIPWLGGTIAMLYLGSQSLDLWMNLLAMLFLDIVLVAFTKAFSRRRRPAYNRDDMMSIGVDKFSFPSGHASRAASLSFFFVLLRPVHALFVLPVLAWSSAVMASRVFLGRHHLLDVVGGFVLALVEFGVMKWIWLSQKEAESWAEFFGAEDPWSSG